MSKSNAMISRAVLETLESRQLLASASVVKDIFAGADSAVSFSSLGDAPVAMGNKLFFAAITEDQGREPWVSDGTAGSGPTTGTFMLKDVLAGSGSSNASQFTLGNGVVYFTANDGTSSAVWKSDGTSSGTVKIASATTAPVSLHYHNGTLFYRESGASAIRTISDSGTTGSVASGLSLLSWVGDVGAFSIFSAADPTLGSTLWATNGSGATFLTDPSSISAFFNPGSVVNGKLVFGMTVENGGIELWRTDGTSGGTQIIGDLAPAAFEGSDPHDFVTIGNKAYFVADPSSDNTNSQIYSTDGDTATKITSLANTSSVAAITDLTNVNGTLFFRYSNGGAAWRLYQLVGGTTPTPVPLGSAGGDGVGAIAAIGSTIFFEALSGGTSSQLFESNGATITKVGGDPGSDASGFTNVNGTLFYAANDATRGTELHMVTAGAVEPPDAFGLRLKIHPNKQGHTNEINEGESLTFEALLTDATVKKVWWDFGDSVLQYWGKGLKPSNILFPDNFLNEETHQVRVKVQSTTGRIQNAKANLTIKNVAPVVKITMPGTWVTWAPMPFAGSVKDTDVEIGNVTLQIDWGDHSAKETIAVEPDGTFSGYHIWTERDLIGRKVRLEFNDSSVSKTKKRTVHIDYVLDASKDAGAVALGFGKSLLIGGTSGNDRITVTRDPETDLLDLLYFGTEDILYKVDMKEDDENNRLFASAWTGDGNDRVEVSESLTTPFKIYGGAGSDTLRGGGGNDALFGQGGSDKLYGRGGKNKVKQ